MTRLRLYYTVILTTLFFCFAFVSKAEIWTYSYPNTVVNGNNSVVKRSQKYEVSVQQGGTTKECYVMYDKNQAAGGNANLASNPDNHFTNFSVDGGNIKIIVKRIDGVNLNFANVFPGVKGYKATINGATATIDIPTGVSKLQLYVEMNGMEDNPLFIFIDPKETDVPNINSSDVTVINTTDDINTVKTKLNSATTYKYFEAGIHKWGTNTGSGYDGYKLPVKSGKKVYLPGGAYVIGSFSGDNASNWKVYGRGIISGAGLDVLQTAEYIPWSAIHHSGNGKGILIEGVTTMCPPHFALTIRGECDIDNVKMLSWWYSTDGTITGDNSTVNNCFFKVNDDGIKVYGDNCTHDNNTMYHQVNGAPFQFSWTGQDGDNTISTNTYIVNSVYKNSLNGTSNTAVVNCREANSGQTIQDHIFDGIYIDNGCHRLLGLDATKGSLKNITIKNVQLRSGNKSKAQNGYSYLDNGTFANIQLCNIYIDGNLITGIDANSDKAAQGKIFFKGQDGPLSFCSTDPDPQGPTDINDLSVSSLNCTQINLQWTDVNLADGYRVRRMQEGETAFSTLEDVNPGVKSYTDNAVLENTNYTYQVRPLQNGVAVKTSNMLSLTVPPCPLPEPEDINDLRLSSSLCSAVELNWTATQGEDGYRIRRKKDGEAAFQNLTDVPTGTETYLDNTVVENSTYIYMVRPLVAGVAVKLSNQPSIETPSCLVTSVNEGLRKDLVYPNPTTGTVYLQELSSYVLFDILGNILGEGIDSEINLLAYPSGVYFVKIGTQKIRILKL